MIIEAEGDKLQKQFFQQGNKKKSSTKHLFGNIFSNIFCFFNSFFSALNISSFKILLLTLISCCRQNRRWQEYFDCF